MPFAQLSEVRLEYFEHGAGPRDVVFVHGYQASARVWHDVQHALPADRYRSIAINNRGAGGSDAPPRESDFTVQKFASDVHELVAQLGLSEFMLVGHSLGGATVAQFAVEHPQRVSALVLLDPSSPNGREWSDDEVERHLDERIATRRAQLASGRVGDGVDASAAAALPEHRRLLLEDMKAAPERRLRGSMRSLLKLRLGARVASLPMPVLLVAGDQDAVIPLSTMLESWAMYPPGTGLHVWHGIGHSPNLDCPHELAALLRGFSDETEARRRQTAR